MISGGVGKAKEKEAEQEIGCEMFVLFAGEKYYFFKSENFYFNLNLLLNIRELAKNTLPSTQVPFVMETGPVELKYFQF